MFPPSTRIVALLAFGVALAFATASQAAVLAAAAVAINLMHGPALRVRLGGLLHRSRWLLTMVVVLNAWTTPGGPGWVGAPDWVPSAAGLTLALHRSAALVAMLAAVNLLLGTTSVAELIAGISRVAAPLRVLGLQPAVLGSRLGGTLALLAETERGLRADVASGGWIAAIGRSIAAIEDRALRGA